MTQENKKKPKRTSKGKGRKRKKSPWSSSKTKDGRTIWSRDVPGAPDVELVMGERSKGSWVGGLYYIPTDELQIYTEFQYRTAKEGKSAIDKLLKEVQEDVATLEVRVANRDVGDIVLVAEQFHTAKQNELDLMKRGTPEELARARKKTKLAKKALDDMTGTNRELYGAIGGGTLGAALGALTGNVFASAIGALAGSVVGSVVAAPSLPREAPLEQQLAQPRDDGTIPFPRRPTRPRTGRGYVANPDDLRRRLTKL